MNEPQHGPLTRLLRRLWHGLNLLRMAVLNGLFLLIVLIVVAALLIDQPAPVPVKGALVLNLDGDLVEEYSYIDPVMHLIDGGNQVAETRLRDVIKALERAAVDDRIDTLVLQLDGLRYSGLSKLQEIAPALEAFRQQGKRIVAVGDNYDQHQYWLAAHADEIYMHPMGTILLRGYGVYRSYYRELLEQLAVQVHLFRVGEYKSAMEPFIRDGMSPADRRATSVWLESLWSQYTGAVAARRGIDPARLARYVNAADEVLAARHGNAAQAALDFGLIDGIQSRSESNRYLASLVGADSEGRYQGIGFRDYLARVDKQPVDAGADRVGVIVASGVIVDGEQPPGAIGGDSMARLIERAARDSSVKALVLRVDSEGGSAFASEVIRQQLLAFKQTGKPLVVSMGSTAASGGYWIAAPADEIWATAATLTGSIGIFGAFPTFDQTLEKVGIHNDGVGTTTMADAFSLERPMNPVAAGAIQQYIEHGYRQFLAVVASGRNMTAAKVDSIAQGRVWVGRDAQDIGLVDKIGGLAQAVEAAASLAQLSDYRLRVLEPALSPAERLLRRLLRNARALSDQREPTWHRWLTPVRREWRLLQHMNDPRGAYAYCGVCFLR